MPERLTAHMCPSCWRKLERSIHAATLNEPAHLRSIAAQLSRCRRQQCKTAAAAVRLAAKLTTLRGGARKVGEWLKL